MRNCKMRRSK